jgi:hypothetical protein
MSYLVNPPFLAAIMKRWELRVSQALGDDLYFSPAWTRKYPDVAAGMGATNEAPEPRPSLVGAFSWHRSD